MKRSGPVITSKPTANAWREIDAIFDEAAQLIVQPEDITVRLYLSRLFKRTGLVVAVDTARRRLNKLPGLLRVDEVYDPATRRLVSVWRAAKK